MTDISSSDDVIDLRYVIKRYEELETETEGAKADEDNEIWTSEDGETDLTDEVEERDRLKKLLDELKGYGGDEQWRGDWYPITLVRDSYFQDYAEQLADDLGYLQRDVTWPFNHIDWEAAANELKHDYSTVDFDGATYWYR